MPEHYHAIVWIDHQQAKVFHFNIDEADATTVRSSHPHQHLHHKANAGDSGHAPLDKAFLEQASQALAGARAILITGPANAKKELASYLQQKHPDIAARVSAVEAADHPSDGQLLALARRFFRADDRMHPQSSR
jgi:DNA-binding MurR/RpiR family transcriptional regulator